MNKQKADDDKRAAEDAERLAEFIFQGDITGLSVRSVRKGTEVWAGTGTECHRCAPGADPIEGCLMTGVSGPEIRCDLLIYPCTRLFTSIGFAGARVHRAK